MTKTRQEETKDAKPAKAKRLSAYFLFAKDHRPELTEANPTLRVTEIAKLTGLKWRELTTEQKAEWNEKARIYNQECAKAS